MIELIPPVHQRVYKMGLEHLGVVVGDTFDAFVEAHKPVLTGQQFQGPNSTPDPVYILFEDFTHVKFYRLSLRASVELDEGRRSTGSTTSTTGSRSGWSRRPARTCRDERPTTGRLTSRWSDTTRPGLRWSS